MSPAMKDFLTELVALCEKHKVDVNGASCNEIDFSREAGGYTDFEFYRGLEHIKEELK